MPSILVGLFYSQGNYQDNAMSISESVNNLVAVMGTLPTAFNSAVTKKRAATKEADVTNALDGSSLSVVQTAMNASLVSHSSAPGAHNPTAQQIGTYTKDEANVLLDGIPSVTTNPISQFGDLNYLSVGATAFFEGATTNGSELSAVLNIEDDGGLVYLRNGTNGSMLGVFYAYVPNALSAVATPNKTNRRYHPPFIPNDKTVQYVVRSGNGVVAGRVQDSTGVAGDFFLALMGGTLDDANHTGCFVSLADWPITGNYPGEVMLGNDGAYLIVNSFAGDNNNALGFSVYFVSNSKMKSGGYVVPELLTGWVTQSYYGVRANNNIIILADKVKGTSTDQNALIVTNGPYDNTWSFHEGAASTFSAQHADGTIRTRISNGIYAANYASGGEIIRGFVASFTFNPYTKTAAVDVPGTAPVIVDYRQDGAVTINGPTIVGGLSDVVPVGGWGFRTSIHYHPTGRWFGVSMYHVVDASSHLSTSPNTNGPMSFFDALHQDQRLGPAYNEAPIPAQYGSAVGGRIAGSTVLPNNRLIVYCEGRNAAGNTVRDSVLCERGAPGFTYRSQYGGTYPGWAPTVKRDFLTDISKSPPDFAAVVSEIDTTGNVKASGSFFVQGSKRTGFLNVDGDLNVSGSVSIVESIFVNLTTAIRTAAGLNPTPPAFTSLMIVVPQNASTTPFGLLMFLDENAVECAIFAELKITAGSRSDAITGMSLLSVSALITYGRSRWMEDGLSSIGVLSGGVTIYEADDCYMVGGTSKTYTGRTGSAGGVCFRFAIPKATSRLDWTTLYVSAAGMDSSTNFFTAIPGVGFGYNSQDTVGSDGYTKLAFNLCARNLEEFRTFPLLEHSIQVSQDVAMGWFVYFTQEIPFLLNGGYGVMPMQTFDLTALFGNPANMTIYVYLSGTPQTGYAYSFSTTPLEETSKTMFIGTITTGATSITKIDIIKVTRLGSYRISTTNKGKSIPATSGNPSENKNLLWT